MHTCPGSRIEPGFIPTTNTAVRTPTAFLYIDHGDPDHICVAHSPTVFPANVGTVTLCDNLLVALVGNDHLAAATICFPNTAGQRTAATRCLRTQQIAAALAAAPPVLRSGPHGDAVANTSAMMKVRTTIKELRIMGTRIKVRRIPGHCGNKGNDKAGELAK